MRHMHVQIFGTTASLLFRTALSMRCRVSRLHDAESSAQLLICWTVLRTLQYLLVSRGVSTGQCSLFLIFGKIREWRSRFVNQKDHLPFSSSTLRTTTTSFLPTRINFCTERIRRRDNSDNRIIPSLSPYSSYTRSSVPVLSHLSFERTSLT